MIYGYKMTSYKYDDILDEEGIKPLTPSEKASMGSDSNSDNSNDTSEKKASLRPLQNVENISLSSAAVSKAFRMMTRQEIENSVQRCHKYTVYKVADQSEYHIIRGGYVIIVSVNQSNAEVVTQMHKHKDYSLDTYVRAN